MPRLIAALAVLALALPAAAQYPEKPVTLLAGYPPGVPALRERPTASAQGNQRFPRLGARWNAAGKFGPELRTRNGKLLCKPYKKS